MAKEEDLDKKSQKALTSSRRFVFTLKEVISIGIFLITLGGGIFSVLDVGNKLEKVEENVTALQKSVKNDFDKTRDHIDRDFRDLMQEISNLRKDMHDNKKP